MSVVSARTFNQSPCTVKAMATQGPVFVTDRGKASVVLLTVDDYERIAGGGRIHDSLRLDVDVELEPVVSRELGRVVDL